MPDAAARRSASDASEEEDSSSISSSSSTSEGSSVSESSDRPKHFADVNWDEEEDASDDADFDAAPTLGADEDDDEEEEEEEEDDDDDDVDNVMGSSSEARAAQLLRRGPSTPYAVAPMLDLHHAVDDGDAARVAALIASREAALEMDGPFSFRQRDAWGCSALHLSVLSPRRKLEIFTYLLSKAKENDLFAKCQNSPLPHVILSVGVLPDAEAFAKEALELLAEKNPELVASSMDEYGRTPLRLACELANGIPTLQVVLRAVATSAAQQEGGSAAEIVERADAIEGKTAAHVAAAQISDEWRSRALQELVVAAPSAPRASGLGKTSVALLDRYGRQALHYVGISAREPAAYAELETLLVRHCNVDPAARDLLGKSARDYARRDASRHRVARRGPSVLFTHPDCVEHHTCPPQQTLRPWLNPEYDVPAENVNRLRVLLDEGTGTLRGSRLAHAGLTFKEAPMVEMGDIMRVHDWGYIQRFINQCAKLDGDELDHLDGDTTFSAKTWDAARRAAGACCAAVDELVSGAAENAFCAVRPPGHHAGPEGLAGGCTTHGFCILNNVAIAAGYAMTRHRETIKRIAIMDFDVHHGNGTEVCVECLKAGRTTAKFETPLGGELKLSLPTWRPWLGDRDAENVLFTSVHGWGKPDPEANASPYASAYPGSFYPGSGETTSAKRLANPATNIVNFGQTTRSRHDWRAAWVEMCDRVRAFKPDLIIVSAGFDAHAKDSINAGYCGALEADYAWLTKAIVGVANDCGAQGRVLSILEGGYRIQGRNVSAFARSVHDHVAALAEARPDHVFTREEADWEREMELARQAAQAERQRLRQEKIEREALEAAAAAQAQVGEDLLSLPLQEVVSPSTGGSSASAAPPPSLPSAEATPAPEESARPKRRAAADIDFVKLNEKINLEKSAKRAKTGE